MSKPKIIKHVLLTIEMEKDVDDLPTLMADRVFGIDGKSPMSDVTASLVPDSSLVIDDKGMVLFMALAHKRFRPSEAVKALDWFTSREADKQARNIEVTYLDPADLDAEARRLCADMNFVLPEPSQSVVPAIEVPAAVVEAECNSRGCGIQTHCNGLCQGVMPDGQPMVMEYARSLVAEHNLRVPVINLTEPSQSVMTTKYDDYATWSSVGRELHKEHNGSLVGLELWKDYSKDKGGYDEAALVKTWHSFNPPREPVMLSTAQEKLFFGLPLSSEPTLDVTGV